MAQDKPMDDNLRTQIFIRLDQKDTDELVDIWKKHDQNEWSQLAFDVIREILEARQVELPLPDEPSRFRPEIDAITDMDELERKIEAGEAWLRKAEGKVTGAWVLLIIILFLTISMSIRSLASGAWVIIAGFGLLYTGLNVWRLHNASKQKSQAESELAEYREKKAELQAAGIAADIHEQTQPFVSP